MQKEEFKTNMAVLLPKLSAPAMQCWITYAEELDQEKIEAQSHFFDALYVEFSLIKQHHGAETAMALFDYGEHFTWNPFELRDAARLIAEGWSLEKIVHHVLENGCEPTPEEAEESAQALRTFLEQREEVQIEPWQQTMQ